MLLITAFNDGCVRSVPGLATLHAKCGVDNGGGIVQALVSGDGTAYKFCSDTVAS